jgi:hypothetical protein
MTDTTNALSRLKNSFKYYSEHAGASRRRHQILEVALLAAASSIPVTALTVPGNGVVTAIIGAVVVVLAGLRQIFHWNENFMRFTQACQALQAERWRYELELAPYDDPNSREKILIDAVIRIETDETGSWIEIQRHTPETAKPQ